MKANNLKSSDTCTCANSSTTQLQELIGMCYLINNQAGEGVLNTDNWILNSSQVNDIAPNQFVTLLLNFYLGVYYSYSSNWNCCAECEGSSSACSTIQNVYNVITTALGPAPNNVLFTQGTMSSIPATIINYFLTNQNAGQLVHDIITAGSSILTDNTINSAIPTPLADLMTNINGLLTNYDPSSTTDYQLIQLGMNINNFRQLYLDYSDQTPFNNPYVALLAQATKASTPNLGVSLQEYAKGIPDSAETYGICVFQVLHGNANPYGNCRVDACSKSCTSQSPQELCANAPHTPICSSSNSNSMQQICGSSNSQVALLNNALSACGITSTIAVANGTYTRQNLDGLAQTLKIMNTVEMLPNYKQNQFTFINQYLKTFNNYETYKPKPFAP